jgi:hypothetical protein
MALSGKPIEDRPEEDTPMVMGILRIEVDHPSEEIRSRSPVVSGWIDRRGGYLFDNLSLFK